MIPRLALLAGLVALAAATDTPAAPPTPRFPAVPAAAPADGLPEGAVVRLGSADWRPGASVRYAAFLPDGKSVLAVTWDYEAVTLDLGTGKVLRRLSVAGPDAKLTTYAVASFRDNHHPHHHRTLVTADGKLLATPGIDGTLRVWDLAAGKVVFTAPEKLQNPAIAFAGDGSRLAVRTDYNEVTVYEAKTWKAVCTTPKPTERPHASLERIEMSGDGKLLFEGGQFPFANGMSGPPQLIVRDADTGAEKARFSRQFRDPPKNFAELIDEFDVTADGKLLVKPFIAGLAFHDLTTGKEVFDITGEQKSDRFHEVRFVDGGRKVFAYLTGNVGGEQVLAVLDVATKKELHRITLTWKSHLIGPWGFIYGHWPSPDGKRVAIGYGTSLRVYDFETGKLLAPADGLPVSAVTHIVFAADGKSVVTGTRDFDFHRWDAATGKGEALKVPGKPTFFAALSPDGKTFVIGEQGGGPDLKVFDAATSEMKYGPKVEPLQKAVVRPGGIPANPQPEHPRLSHGAAAFFTPDSKYFLLNQREGSVRVFEVATGKQVPNLGTDTRRDVTSVPTGYSMGYIPFAMSHDSQTILIPASGALASWEITAEQATPLRSAGYGRALALSPDRRALAQLVRGAAATNPKGVGIQPKVPAKGTTTEESIVLTELATGAVRATIKVTTPENENLPQPAVFTPDYLQYTHLPPLAYSPDGRLIAFGTPDRKVRVWDVYGNREAATFAGHTGEVLALAFSPDGSKLVSGSADATALVWDLGPARKKLAGGAALDDEKLHEAWTNLAGVTPDKVGGLPKDIGKVGEAIAALVADPARAVPFLREKMAASADAKRFPALIEALGSPDALARYEALQEIEGLGASAFIPLREAQKTKKFTPDVVTALQRLQQVQPPGTTYRAAGHNRVVRAVEVLEVLAAGGSKEAADLIRELGTAANDRPATVEAYDAHQRLTKKK